MVISDKDSGLHHLCKHHEQQLIEGVELPNLFYFLELNYVFLYDKGNVVVSPWGNMRHHEQQLIEGVELPNLLYFLELNYVFLYDKGDAVESKQHSPTCNSGGFD